MENIVLQDIVPIQSGQKVFAWIESFEIAVDPLVFNELQNCENQGKQKGFAKFVTDSIYQGSQSRINHAHCPHNLKFSHVNDIEVFADFIYLAVLAVIDSDGNVVGQSVDVAQD